MARSGPIIIVEDDLDDQDLIGEVIKDLGITNELIFFEKANPALHFLKTTDKKPLIIICDINMPELNGLEFKLQIDSDIELRQKSIPFIFFSTSASRSVVQEAYTKMTVQGFFKKCSSITDLQKTLKAILDYWLLCVHPNSED